MIAETLPSVPAELPEEVWSARFDDVVRTTNDALLTTAAAWNELIKAHFVFAETSRRALGGLLIQWHGSVVGRRRA